MAIALKIPFVGDDLMMAKTLSDILEFQGYRTVTANFAAEALDRASGTTFDCVSSGTRMPKMSGVELHQAMRLQLGDMPTTVMTAHSETRWVQQSVDAGVLAIFTEPLDLAILSGFLQALPDRLSNSACEIRQSSLGRALPERNSEPGRVISGESLTSRRRQCESL